MQKVFIVSYYGGAEDNDNSGFPKCKEVTEIKESLEEGFTVKEITPLGFSDKWIKGSVMVVLEKLGKKPTGVKRAN